MDIHRCRFVPYTPSAINALAFSHPSIDNRSTKNFATPPTLRLAIGRANGDIEVWNPASGLWIQETILRSGKDRSIEGLVWVQDPEDADDENGHRIPGKLRLFSIGYSTSVTEWDLATGKPVRHSGGNYGEIWCMAVQPRSVAVRRGEKMIENGEAKMEDAGAQSIAVGCADGTIVLLSTADDDLRFTRLVARSSKKGARVLSITFQDRYTAVAGYADSTIRVYDIRSGRQLRNMTLGAGPKGGPREILVWSVRCLADGSIISGDSTGTMCFWDGKTYTLTQRIRAHEADILDVAVSADGQSAFSGGMDRRIVFYKRSGNGKAGRQSRWAKMSHSRMHKHDVKTMSPFEDHNLSVLATGGLDTNPLIVPIQQFGRELHRTLSSLPQQPVLLSVPKRRLMISWWDREINIWAIVRGSDPQVEKDEGQDVHAARGKKLVAKVMLSGEESIASVSITPGGSLLAVSTITSTKTFLLSPRKDGTLKLHKISVPPSMAENGAKILQFSPDSKWLCVVLPADEIKIYEVIHPNVDEGHSSLRYLERAMTLHRISRTEKHLKPIHGTLGKYDRSINRVAFSAASNILVVSDLSGHLDTWVLNNIENPIGATTHIDSAAAKNNELSSLPSTGHSAESSDSEDEKSNSNETQNGGWITNPSGSLLPKLPSAALVLSFRPTPSKPHEDRLIVTTGDNHLLEFHALAGKLTDWSRRNPPSVFPLKFKAIMDRAKGVIWDLHEAEGRQRVWLYGLTWLWMFDLRGDISRVDYKPVRQGEQRGILHKGDEVNGASIEEAEEADQTTTTALSKRKRKRKGDNDESNSDHHDDGKNDSHQRYLHKNFVHCTSGAGSMIPDSKLTLGLGRKIRKIDGEGLGHDKANREQNNLSSLTNSNQPQHELLQLTAPENNTDTNIDLEENDDPSNANRNPSANPTHAAAITAMSSSLLSLRREEQAPPTITTTEGNIIQHHLGQTYHTFKYRPILGIVPLSSGDPFAADGELDKKHGVRASGVEVALVERPLWDLELPGRFEGEREWNE